MKYIAATVAALVLSTPAQAALQIYEFTASVTNLGDVANFGWVPSASGRKEGSLISVHDRVVGRFAYDSSTTSTSNSDSWDPNPASTTYSYSSAPSPASLFSFTILPSGQTVNVGDANTPLRVMSLHDARPIYPGSTDMLSMRIQGIDMESTSMHFIGSTANWAVNGGLPEHLALADMSRAYMQHDYYTPDGARILMLVNITSLQQLAISPVPEPGTWAMLLAGLTVLGFSARRKRA